MAFFVLNSDITIGGFRFSGVHEVRIQRSMHSINDTASITIPSVSTVKFKTGAPLRVTTANLFTDGDAVSIKLGYNGLVQEEFRGFVRRRDLAMPLVVECEGYGRQLRLNVDYTSGSSDNPVATSAIKLLRAATKGTDIKVQCPVDFPIQKFYALHADGIRICDFIRDASDRTLTLFFIKPDTLWCGLRYTPYATGGDPFNLSLVNYRLGYNVVKDNQLKEKLPSERVDFFYNGKLASGTVMHTDAKDKSAQRKVTKLLNNIPDVTTLNAFAQEKVYMSNYSGYEGKINAFLEPFALPGFRANIVDDRYPERNGVYMIESTEVTFGVSGARRKVEIGPKLSFNNG